jgi:hypothetical protein
MDNIPFKMTYNALKMFGRQLYSNPWGALSELVANGFDAIGSNASVDVYLYINIKDKRNAIIELFDNGIGMDNNDFASKYVTIGRNRRTENNNDNATGRKGIGKLAALYLSDDYTIISKKNKKITAWGVNVANMKDTDKPCLKSLKNGNVSIVCARIWNNFNSGTLIKLKNVNLLRIGEAAIEALKYKLSNHFLFNSKNKKLYICIDRKGEGPNKFIKINKNIAFGNMTNIYCNNKTLISTKNKKYKLSYTNKKGVEKIIKMDRMVSSMPEYINTDSKKSNEKILLKGKQVFYGIEKEYELKGWIGVHVSIDLEEAIKNDKKYIKNQFYNPNQIRIYVRNKLATENILNKLGLHGTYERYLEGELSFDILDDNDLDDIATTNRQDFFNDERVELLIKLLRGLGRRLMIDRQNVKNEQNKIEEEENTKIINEEKTNFIQEINEDFNSANVPNEITNKLIPIIGNKLKGEYELKDSYKLFISHSIKDRIFTDFISHYLQKRGFIYDKNYDITEIFYSTDGLDITCLDPLSEIIKNLIIRDNTQILFLTSENFNKSQYCLFEGGAAWATRSIGEYGIIALDYNSIPKFLTNDKAEFSFNLEDRDSFILNKQNYENIVIILNRAIAHLNKNRAEKNKVKLIEKKIIKDKVEANAEHKEEKDYMDPLVRKYWETYVENDIEKYLAKNKK